MMWKISVLGFFLLIATVVKNSSGYDLPAGIEKCIYGDGECMLRQVNKTFEKYPHGNPELAVPDLNPFKLSSLDVSQDSSKTVNLNLKMTDVEIVDFNTVRYFNMKPAYTNDWNNTVFSYEAFSPVMNIRSKYTIKGKILVLPIEGSGDMTMVLTNARFAIKLKTTTHKEGEKTYVTIDKFKIKTEAENMKIQMNNLFNGDKALGDNLNKVINENWKILWDEVEPAVDRAFAETMRAGMNNFFKTHAIEDIFLFKE